MEELTFKVCDHCHGKMLPQTMSQTFRFNGKEIEIKGIQGYRCESCGNEVYEAKEIRMIDKIIRAMNDKPAVDILNLDETADYLRVSNQTVYNMIKDGRIKAYKVGREWLTLWHIWNRHQAIGFFLWQLKVVVRIKMIWKLFCTN